MSCPQSNLPPPDSDRYHQLFHENKGPSIVIVCWVFTGVALAFIVARLYVRGCLLKRFRADDTWATLGWFCTCLCTVFISIAVGYGSGRHCVFLTVHMQERINFWTFIAWWFGVLGFSLPKLAVVSLLCRLLNPSRWHRWLLWGMATFNIVNLFIVMMLILFRCNPIQTMWNFSLQGTCMSSNVSTGYSLYAASYSAFLDLYLSIYPSVVLYKLKLPRKKKIYLSLALGLGCVSCAIAIYKTTRLPPGLSEQDVSYETSDLTTWTIVEGCVIIMAATVPVLAPLLDIIRRWRGKHRGSSSERSERSEQSEWHKLREGPRRHRSLAGGDISQSNTSTTGEHSQDIMLNGWTTFYGLRAGDHRHEYPDKDRRDGEV